MTEPDELLPELDAPPRDGVFRHLEDQPATAAEMAEGNRLGALIDLEDDGDNGGVTPLPTGRMGAGTSASASAMADAQSLRVALLDWGVPAVSIELQPGAGGSGWHTRTFRRVLGHHTVSRPSNGLTPVLGLCKGGRTDLVGPLCNGYGGYDRVARILCMAWANHPGAGGPWPGPGGTVPKDNGRPYVFGWEFEGGIEPWTDAMHTFMAQCLGASAQWMGQSLECVGEHGDPWAKGRKIDRLGYTAASGRQRIQLAGAEKTMARLDNEDREWLEAMVQRNMLDAIDTGYRKGTSPDNRIGFMIADTHKTTRAIYDATFGVNDTDRSGKRHSLLRQLLDRLTPAPEQPAAPPAQ